eukprot:scaffold8828_cov129-Isochrysis_galbana.AAC.8
MAPETALMWAAPARQPDAQPIDEKRWRMPARQWWLLHQPSPPPPPPPPADCWFRCGGGGPCDGFCGAGGACCRLGYAQLGCPWPSLPLPPEATGCHAYHCCTAAVPFPPSLPPRSPPSPPPPPPPPMAPGICTDWCYSARNGECDDGGHGAVSASCGLGTDCSDCGER